MTPADRQRDSAGGAPPPRRALPTAPEPWTYARGPGVTPPRRRPRRRRGPGWRSIFGLAVLATVLAVWTWAGSPQTATPRGRPALRLPPAPRAGSRPAALFTHPLSRPALRPGSDPAALPGPILIADSANNRLLVVSPRGQVLWRFPGPAGLPTGQTFIAPDDAFFTPDGRSIVATQETDSAISLIAVGSRRIIFRYGVSGVPGAGPNHLANPDDAQLIDGRDLLAADIENCRLVVIAPGTHVLARAFGETTSACLHQPPRRFGSPNGAFPMGGGDVLVTEINGDWVDVMTLTGRIVRQLHPPGVLYPSDTNLVRPGVLLTADYSWPGQVVMFTLQGRTLWRYRPTGANALDHPSLALPLPNGDVLINDDRNDRVIVVDPRTDRIVWQYGVTGVPGSAPGFLNVPDGVDLAPPYSEDITRGRAAAPVGPR